MTIDNQIIQDCIDGNRSAQERLYRFYAPQMLGISLRYTSSYDDAEDILQEGFIKVFLNLSNFRNEGSFEGWIKRIFINTALNHYNQKSRSIKSQDLDFADEQELEDDDDIETYSEDEMLSAIQQLPEGYKMVFNLYVFEDYKHKEIAELLGITVNTSKSQLSKARIYLQKSLLKNRNIIKDQ